MGMCNVFAAIVTLAAGKDGLMRLPQDNSNMEKRNKSNRLFCLFKMPARN